MIFRKERSRHRLALPLTVFVTAAAAALGTVAASAAPHSPAIAPAHAASTNAPSSTVTKAQYAVPGAVLGSGGWQVLSSAKTTSTGAQISSPAFSTTGWLPVQNDDGGAPGTEIEALLQNGACPNAYYSTNMKTCFGYMSTIGADTV